MAGVNVSALGFGGIDTSSLVSSLVAVESQPLNQLAAKQQKISSAQASISSFSSTLSALKTAAAALSDPTTFTSMGAKSSDSSVVTSVNGMAAPGQWSVSVTALAQEQRTLSNGNMSNTTALGLSGDLGITIGTGSPATVSISATDTLADVASKISASGMRVRASTVYDGTQYHLLVSGLDTGAANTVSFDESGLSGSAYSLGLSDPKSAIQNAQDAKLTVGGLAITSPTNQVQNAIPGVTLAVTQLTTTPANVSIASDPSSIQQKVQTFVTAYNAVVSGGHTLAGFGTVKATNTLLQGDRAVRSSLDQLGSLMAQSVPGASGAYTTLSSIGIALQNDGTLMLDSTKLSTALTADPTSIARLFVTDASNGSQGVMGTIGTLTDTLKTGTRSVVQSELDAFTSVTKQNATQMTAMQTRIDAYQTRLQKQFTQMNAALAQYKRMASSLNNLTGSSSSSSSSGSL